MPRKPLGYFMGSRALWHRGSVSTYLPDTPLASRLARRHDDPVTYASHFWDTTLVGGDLYAVTSLADRIRADVVVAMKSGDKRKVETLRLLQSDLKYRQIELGSSLEQADVEAVLRRAAKKRREAIEAYEKGQRGDLADREAAELALIEAYLPAELSDDRLDEIIREVISEAGGEGPPELGRIMSTVMPRLQGQASGQRVRARVQSLLQEQ